MPESSKYKITTDVNQIIEQNPGTIFAGGSQSLKVFFPAASIPIEVGKQLYEIYTNRKQQLPGS
jgi:hypothetical protein